jgi:hypothetical protein
MKQSISKSTFKAKAKNTNEAPVRRDRVKPAEVLESLRGSVLRYDDPLESVGLEAWEVLR